MAETSSMAHLWHIRETSTLPPPNLPFSAYLTHPVRHLPAPAALPGQGASVPLPPTTARRDGRGPLRPPQPTGPDAGGPPSVPVVGLATSTKGEVRPARWGCPWRLRAEAVPSG